MTTSLDTRSKDTIVGAIAAGMQGRISSVFLNFAKGKIFRALAEAHAGANLWLQKSFVQVLALTRASTSDGDDLDTWVADYGLSRLGAVASSGLVVFGRYTAAPVAVVISNGAQVQTIDGSLRFTVYADPTIGTYSSSAGGYVLPAGVATIQVPVTCTTLGSIGNASAGSIALLASAVSGVDTVTNPASFSNGVDAESDVALRARFVLFINSLAKATETAIGAAITGLGQGLRYSIIENQAPDGTTTYGFVTVYVDDGSGNPSSDLIAAAAQAVNAVRAAGVRVGVFGASTLGASVQMSLQVADGYYRPDVVATVVGALSTYINGLPLGARLPYSRLAQVAFDASPAVTNVTGITLNGAAADLVPTLGQTVKLTSLVVT